MARRRGSSMGNMDFGDTQGSSISSARVENTRHLRRSSRTSISPEVTRATASDKKEPTPVAAVNTSSRKRNSKKRVARTSSKGPFGSLVALAAKNTWLVPLVILLSAYAGYFLSAQYHPDSWLNMCVKLSYPMTMADGTTRYGEGYRDFFFLAFNVVTFTFIREFCMQVALTPLAGFFGITSKHKVNRFLEQTYSMLYYGTMGPLGLFIMKYKCPEMWFFNVVAFYEDFPHRDHDPWFKAFYLLQAAFWAQQALVLALNLEKRRRDFKELVFHHIVTVALIYLSYRFHFTRMGLAVYITMDVSDFFLATSKTLNYIDSPIVAPFFFVFVCVWAYLRHYLNLVILKSITKEFVTVGPFDLNWETQQYKCWISQYITFALLAALQLVNFYWFVLIIKIALRFVFTGAKEDVRSDDEEEEEEEEELDEIAPETTLE